MMQKTRGWLGAGVLAISLLATAGSAQAGWLHDAVRSYQIQQVSATERPVAAVPEPTGVVLFGAGALVVAAALRRRRSS